MGTVMGMVVPTHGHTSPHLSLSGHHGGEVPACLHFRDEEAANREAFRAAG